MPIAIPSIKQRALLTIIEAHTHEELPKVLRVGLESDLESGAGARWGVEALRDAGEAYFHGSAAMTSSAPAQRLPRPAAPMPVRHIRCGRRETPRAECRGGRSLSAGALAGALAPAANERTAPARLRFFVHRRFLRDDQGVVLLELGIRPWLYSLGRCGRIFSPLPTRPQMRSVGRGEKGVHSLRSAERLISTDPALRRRQVVSRDLRRCPISI